MGKVSSRNQRAVGRRAHLSARQRPVNVMIADDQALVRAGLAQLLEAHAGCRVVAELDDALALLEAAEHTPPSAAIMDATMPQALRAAKLLLARCGRTHVILLDEQQDAVNLRRAVDAGFAGYLTKHDQPGDFVAAIRRVLAGETAFPSFNEANAAARPTPSWGAGRDGPTPAVLTARELEILTHLATGMTVRACAARLGISPNTVENHKARIMRKIGLHKTVDLTRFAIHYGIVPDDR